MEVDDLFCLEGVFGSVEGDGGGRGAILVIDCFGFKLVFFVC